MPDPLSTAGAGAAAGSVGGPIGAAIGGGVGLVGGALASILGGADRAAAANTVGKGLQAYQDMPTKVSYNAVKDMGPSAYNTADNTGNTALKDALSQLQAKYRAGGLTAGDMSQVAQLQQAQAGQAAANRAAVENTMRARGQTNSGTNYISQLVGGQQSAQQALQQAQQQAQIAQQQKMAALQGATSTGQQLQGNAYTVAGANDAVNSFNKNIQMNNSQNQLNADQDSVTNSLNRAGGMANVYANQGNVLTGQAGATQAAVAGGAQATGQLASGIYNATKGSNTTPYWNQPDTDTTIHNVEGGG